MSSAIGLPCSSYPAAVLSVGILAVTLFALGRHKGQSGVFVIAFLLHLLAATPGAFADEGQVAKREVETASRNLPVPVKATPAPFQFPATETDSQARKQTENTKNEPINAKETGLSRDSSVQPLVSAVSTVDVTIKTTRDIDFHTFDRGGYAAIATARGPMLVTRGGDCSGKQSGPDEATFHGIFREMTASGTAKSSAIGRPIADLRGAEFVQIEFAPMEANPVVVRGKVIFTLNNSRELHFEIPPQVGIGKKIYVRDLSSGMKALNPAPTP